LIFVTVMSRLNPVFPRELGAGCHVELPEYFAEAIVDRARADEQLCGDLPVGQPAASGRSSSAGARARSPVARSSDAFPGDDLRRADEAEADEGYGDRPTAFDKAVEAEMPGFGYEAE
jgi:hypothetical protein